MEKSSSFRKKTNIDFILGALNESVITKRSDGMLDITYGMPHTSKFLMSMACYALSSTDDNGDTTYELDQRVWVLSKDMHTFVYTDTDYSSIGVRHYAASDYIKSVLREEYTEGDGVTMVLCDKECATLVASTARILCNKGSLVGEKGGVVYTAACEDKLSALFIAGDYPQNCKAKRVLFVDSNGCTCIFKAIGHGSWKLVYKTKGPVPTDICIQDTLGNVIWNKDITYTIMGPAIYDMSLRKADTDIAKRWRSIIC